MKSTRIAAVLLAALAVAVAAGCGGSEAVPTDAVAVVNGEEVPKSQLDALLARVKTSYEAQKRKFPKAGTPEYQSLQSQAVAYLVQRVEYSQEADDLGIKITDQDVDKRVAEVKKSYFKNDEKQFKSQLKQQGYTLVTFRDDVRIQLLSDKLFKQITKDVKVTDKDIEAYYTKNKAQYQVPESREVRHILVKTKAEATKLYDQLKTGGDFVVLAKKYSLDPGSKNQGGKLTVSRGQTVAPFDQTAFLLSKGSLSRPVKTQFGFHLIEALGDVKPGRTTPLKEVKAQIRSQLAESKRNEALTSWSEDVKKEYEKKVSYQTGFAPPAAATEQSTTTG